MPRRMNPSRWIDELPGASDALRALARRGEIKVYAKGRVMIEEGEPGDTLLIILAGRLRAFAEDERGREVVYAHYGPGEYVGEMSLDGGLRSASVMALERSTCAVVTRRQVEAHLAEHPAFAFELLTKVIRRARAATLSARALALNDCYGRLRQLLESLAETAPDGPRPLRERLTHREIAARIGSSREMISRILKDLERGGYLASARGQLTLLRPLPAKW
jgi:CRP/FNR family transcriptional regulator, cyclic AMP receptor protein